MEFILGKKVNCQEKKYEGNCCSCQEIMFHKYFQVTSHSELTVQRLLITYVKDDWRKNEPWELNIETFWEIYRQSPLEPFVYIPGVVNLETFSFLQSIYLYAITDINFFPSLERWMYQPPSFIVLWLLSCDTYPVSVFIPSSPYGDSEHENWHRYSVRN